MSTVRGAARDASIRSRLDAAVASVSTHDRESKAHAAIWAAVLLSMGMGVVPFGINVGWFVAVATGLILYLGELYGYVYSKKQAGRLLKQLFSSHGKASQGYVFGLKFMAEALKGAGIITLGGATPVGMALDAGLSGAITYAVGFTALKYFEENEDLPSSRMRAEFRQRFAEGQTKVRALARQQAAEAGGEMRARYAEATRQAREGMDALKAAIDRYK